MKKLLFIIMLTLPLLAKMPNETKWITQIRPTDQGIVLHFINNKLNAYIAKDLRSKAKSSEEDNEITLVSSLYKSTLSNLATKNPILKEQLKQESNQLGLMYTYGSSKPTETKKYNMLFYKTSKDFQKYQKSKLQVVFNKYKENIPSTVDAIIMYVNQTIRDTKNGHKRKTIAQIFTDEIQNILGQNNGRIKATIATYLISSFAYDETVVINYQIIKKELIQNVRATKGLTHSQAVNSIESSEFKINANKVYSENYHKYYCSQKSTTDALNQGLEIAINMSFDDGTYILGPIEISKTSCLSYGYGMSPIN